LFFCFFFCFFNFNEAYLEFAPSLLFFDCVTEMTLALHFSHGVKTTYEEQIQTAIEAVNPASLLSIKFCVPSRLVIPWPLRAPTPPNGLNAAQMGDIMMRNHSILASMDQEEVQQLVDFATRQVNHVWRDLEGGHQVHVCVSADRGALCFA
jgi:hypothetical protein